MQGIKRNEFEIGKLELSEFRKMVHNFEKAENKMRIENI